MTSCKDPVRPTPEPAFERHPTLLLSLSGSCRETEADVSTEGIQSREMDTEASQGPRVQGGCCRVAQTPGRVAGPSSSRSRWAVLGVLEEMGSGTTRCSRGTATGYVGERAVDASIPVSLTENRSPLLEAVPTCSAGSGVDTGLRGKIAECGRSAGCPTGLGTFPRKRVLLRLLWLLSLLPRTQKSFCLAFTHTVSLFPFGTLKTYPFHLASPNSMIICFGLSFLIHYQGY